MDKRTILRALVCGVAMAAPAPASASVRVIDGDTIDLAGTTVRLFGIDAPERAQTCSRADGRDWACGEAARAALVRLLAGAEVRCDGVEHDSYGRLVARCHAGTQDLGAALVAGGMAVAYRRYSMDYVGIEAGAKRAGIGIWQGDLVTPSDYRAQGAAAVAPVTVTVAGECAIKGNISASGRIYHAPGQRDYAATRISAGKGERWFCTAAEAEAAGWRAALR